MAKIQRFTKVEVGKDVWAIDGVISGLSLLWGEPGCGKSFVAISMAASVASGRPWLGRHTKQGRVAYIVGEGGSAAVSRRMHAALDRWTIDTREEEIPIDLITPGIDLVKGPVEVLNLIGEEPPVLVVVDTLSRCFVGDENKQEFMGQFVRTLDFIRDVYDGVTVLVIHHANKNDDVRGSSVLLGAVDTSWKLDKIKPDPAMGGILRQMVPQKLREKDVDGAYMRMILRQVPCLDVDGKNVLDSFGDYQTSLAVKPHPSDMLMAKNIMNKALGILQNQPTITYHELREGKKPEFDNALSYILTYPGDWGHICQIEPGVFALDTLAIQ